MNENEQIWNQRTRKKSNEKVLRRKKECTQCEWEEANIKHKLEKKREITNKTNQNRNILTTNNESGRINFKEQMRKNDW